MQEETDVLISLLLIIQLCLTCCMHLLIFFSPYFLFSRFGFDKLWCDRKKSYYAKIHYLGLKEGDRSCLDMYYIAEYNLFPFPNSKWRIIQILWVLEALKFFPPSDQWKPKRKISFTENKKDFEGRNPSLPGIHIYVDSYIQMRSISISYSFLH